MHSTRLAALAALFLSACGGGGDSPAPAPVPAPPAPAITSVVVVGNSLAYESANPVYDWSGNWGMAASDAAHDFPHLIAAHYGATLAVVDGSPIERLPATSDDVIASIAAKTTSSTLVVLEIGDNAAGSHTDPATYGAAYGRLMTALAAKHPHRVVCLSTWWTAPAIDSAIQAACTGGSYVPIGDIAGAPGNPDYTSGPQFSNPDVNAHPHDWGHAQMAARVEAG